MRWWRTLAALLLMPLPAGELVTASAQEARGDTAIREVASDTLHDVALVREEGGRPVIYYNPVLLDRLGADLTRYFMMHERGHVAFGHTGSALAGPNFSGNSLRLRQELEADCWATTELLERGDTAAVEAATEFFLQLGKRRHDALHPTGAQRAAKILACTPPDAPTSNPNPAGR